MSAGGTGTIQSDRLELVSLGPAAIDALLAGKRLEVEALARAVLPPDWPDAHDAGFLRWRAKQMRENSRAQQWLVRLLVLRGGERRMIGHAGFHGPPGTNGPSKAGAVEVGYTVIEEFRGCGYATEAVRALLGWARAEHEIRQFVASVSPGNAPSLAIVRKLGFVQTGTQWDEHDGEELVFELALSSTSEPSETSAGRRPGRRHPRLP